jgi:NADH:ubiquinone oxidoreductase subunit 6 (subunit J)
MQNVLSKVRNPALRQGLIFGIILGIILVGLNFIFSGLIIIAVLTLLAAFIAGMRASQETGRTTTGTIAGLWTGLIGLLILSIIALGFLLHNLDAVRKSAQITANQQHLQITYTNSQIITNYLFVYIILIALGILFGVIGGLVGGNFGRRRAQIPPVGVYHEAMFEPPSASETEEPPSETPSEEPPSTSETEEPPSETPSEEPSSSMQQAE